MKELGIVIIIGSVIGVMVLTAYSFGFGNNGWSFEFNVIPFNFGKDIQTPENTWQELKGPPAPDINPRWYEMTENGWRVLEGDPAPDVGGGEWNELKDTSGSSNFTFQEGTLNNLIFALINLINAVIPALVALAVVIFLWGVIKYISAAGDPKQRKEGSRYLLFAVIGFTVIVAFWGLIRISSELLGAPYGIPQFEVTEESLRN